MRIVMRILMFPFLAAIFLIWSIQLYLKTLYLLARYGGESIAYNERMNAVGMAKIYKKLEEIHAVKETV